MMAAHILRLTWSHLQVPVTARVGPSMLLYLQLACLIASVFHRSCCSSVRHRGKAFFVAARAHDTQ
jgi:hypothetical protein